ncbi:MAG: hypothetical protein ABL918_00950 [Chakrabartia sp.]
MPFLRKLTTGAVAAALLATTVTPALARHNDGWGRGHGNGWGHRRHRDRVDAGDVIAGLAIFGVIAAIASSASKSKSTSPRWDHDRDTEYDRRDTGTIQTEDQAVDACAVAAEDRVGQAASVRDISNVKKSDDGWDVDGIIEARDDFRDSTATQSNFSCSVRYGRVETVYIDGQTAALR